MSETKMKTTLTGGYNGFCAAVREAFYGSGNRMSNPGVRYSHARGFHVESTIHPADDDCIWSHQCSIAANSGRNSLIASDYGHIRRQILERQDQLAEMAAQWKILRQSYWAIKSTAAGRARLRELTEQYAASSFAAPPVSPGTRGDLQPQQGNRRDPHEVPHATRNRQARADGLPDEEHV